MQYFLIRNYDKRDGVIAGKRASFLTEVKKSGHEKGNILL